jgi:hypothetical protein
MDLTPADDAVFFARLATMRNRISKISSCIALIESDTLFYKWPKLLKDLKYCVSVY